jgi:hypothetical protein
MELALLVTAGLKAAVTPAGHPDAVSETLLLEPLLPATWIAADALEPTTSVTGLDDALTVKLGCGIVSAIVALLVRLPEVPVTVTVYVPGTGVVPGFSVSVVFAALLAELNEGVTPLGAPDTEKATLPVKPF